jgi:hypothetical protein
LNVEQEKVIADSGMRIRRNTLTMVSKKPDDPDDAKQGLYLYGWIDTSDMHGNHEGYNLPKPAAEILKYVFASLEGKDLFLDGECLKEQREYFHLKPQEDKSEGWVKTNPPPGQKLYRTESCKRRVEK